MELTSEQWERVKVIFEAVLEKPPGDRTSFLGQWKDEPQVLQEVERLLASHHEAGDFLSPPLSPPLDSTAPLQSLPAGVLLSERFRILRFLARGGMGEVYEAEDTELRERVALKTIRPELVEDDRILERFKREVHLAKKVTHPNVCRIFDLFRHQLTKDGEGAGRSLVFVVMELLEGDSLAQRLRHGPRMSAAEALPIALQMASALGAADDTAVRTALTQSGQVFGTPAYLSPEQVESKPLTPASDVYSLGLVLYEMVTGA